MSTNDFDEILLSSGSYPLPTCISLGILALLRDDVEVFSTVFSSLTMAVQNLTYSSQFSASPAHHVFPLVYLTTRLYSSLSAEHIQARFSLLAFFYASPAHHVFPLLTLVYLTMQIYSSLSAEHIPAPFSLLAFATEVSRTRRSSLPALHIMSSPFALLSSRIRDRSLTSSSQFSASPAHHVFPLLTLVYLTTRLYSSLSAEHIPARFSLLAFATEVSRTRRSSLPACIMSSPPGPGVSNDATLLLPQCRTPPSALLSSHALAFATEVSHTHHSSLPACIMSSPPDPGVSIDATLLFPQCRTHPSALLIEVSRTRRSSLPACIMSSPPDPGVSNDATLLFPQRRTPPSALQPSRINEHCHWLPQSYKMHRQGVQAPRPQI
ncbi:uncharacterized protein EDB91DRAFT_1256401 [Suillus paluster]|uniref:uncharacterized protein n=1 Tax=Suillus paluster TaxID=48578 RepID=UPI001B86FC2D|nr:uncharacterized protein EDB91DRAFT_1256401 [Suillus paluster]KAG1721730.1 hypothetical protein EDB91DRAFT_1256401 [Suillus paluster]